jgi:hypothetical protein
MSNILPRGLAECSPLLTGGDTERVGFKSWLGDSGGESAPEVSSLSDASDPLDIAVVLPSLLAPLLVMPRGTRSARP